MNLDTNASSPEPFNRDALRMQAQSILENLEKDESDEAMKTIGEMVGARDQWLFTEIGKLTRSLHNSLINFEITSDGNNKESQMSDASERLTHVIKMTKEAADKTMDKVEETAPIAMQISKDARDIRSDWARLRHRDMTADEFRVLYKKVDVYLESVSTQSDSVSARLQEILLAQEYQDLSGQIIQRVITMVQNVEDSLVTLMRMATSVEEMAGIDGSVGEAEIEVQSVTGKTAEGPIIDTSRADVMAAQDDVDDLLSSLGF